LGNSQVGSIFPFGGLRFLPSPLDSKGCQGVSGMHPFIKTSQFRGCLGVTSAQKKTDTSKHFLVF
jgi:hypothetical protein